MTTSTTGGGPDWDFDYSDMAEQEALAKAAEQFAKCRLLCESEYCLNICSTEYDKLKGEIDEFFNPQAKDAEDLWFCVQRNGVDFRVLGSQIHDKVKEGDIFVVWREGKPYNWRWAEFENTWEQESFWYHVKNLTEELFLFPRYEKGLIWNKETGERVERMLPGGEYIIGGYNEEGHKIRFEGNTGNWDFGEESDPSLLSDGRRFFAKCPNFNGDVSVLAAAQWSDISEMFLNCTSFNQPLASWDPSNIFNNHEMYDFLRGASSFDQDLSSWCMWDRGIYLPIVRLTADEWAEGAPIASDPGKHPNWQCYRDPGTRTIQVDDGSAI